MKIGTRSVLFGAHAFYLHPFFVALAWWRLYGFGRICIQRAVIAYSRPTGGTVRITTPHPGSWRPPEPGGWILERPAAWTSLWDPRLWLAFFLHDIGYLGKPNMDGEEGELHPRTGARIMKTLFGPAWHDFVLYHSRYLAKRDGRSYSILCVADKLALALEPWWLYLPRVIASGEIHEYMRLAEQRARVEPHWARERLGLQTRRGRRRGWCIATMEYCRKWAYEHRDGREDRWTPAGGLREAQDEHGTMK